MLLIAILTIWLALTTVVTGQGVCGRDDLCAGHGECLTVRSFKACFCDDGYEGDECAQRVVVDQSSTQPPAGSSGDIWASVVALVVPCCNWPIVIIVGLAFLLTVGLVACVIYQYCCKKPNKKKKNAAAAGSKKSSRRDAHSLHGSEPLDTFGLPLDTLGGDWDVDSDGNDGQSSRTHRGEGRSRRAAAAGLASPRHRGQASPRVRGNRTPGAAPANGGAAARAASNYAVVPKMDTFGDFGDRARSPPRRSAAAPLAPGEYDSVPALDLGVADPSAPAALSSPLRRDPSVRRRQRELEQLETEIEVQKTLRRGTSQSGRRSPRRVPRASAPPTAAASAPVRSASSRRFRAVLRPVNPLCPVEEIVLDRAGSVRIGRSSRADFKVQAPFVSKIHCTLTVDPVRKTVHVVDNSTNGTFINGSLVEAVAFGSDEESAAAAAPNDSWLLRVGDELSLVPPTQDAVRDEHDLRFKFFTLMSTGGGDATGSGEPADRVGRGDSTRGIGKQQRSFASSTELPSASQYHAPSRSNSKKPSRKGSGADGSRRGSAVTPGPPPFGGVAPSPLDGAGSVSLASSRGGAGTGAAFAAVDSSSLPPPMSPAMPPRPLVAAAAASLVPEDLPPPLLSAAQPPFAVQTLGEDGYQALPVEAAGDGPVIEHMLAAVADDGQWASLLVHERDQVQRIEPLGSSSSAASDDGDVLPHESDDEGRGTPLSDMDDELAGVAGLGDAFPVAIDDDGPGDQAATTAASPPPPPVPAPLMSADEEDGVDDEEIPDVVVIDDDDDDDIDDDNQDAQFASQVVGRLPFDAAGDDDDDDEDDGDNDMVMAEEVAEKDAEEEVEPVRHCVAEVMPVNKSKRVQFTPETAVIEVLDLLTLWAERKLPGCTDDRPSFRAYRVAQDGSHKRLANDACMYEAGVADGDTIVIK